MKFLIHFLSFIKIHFLLYYKFVHVRDIDGKKLDRYTSRYRMIFRINWMFIINNVFFQAITITISELYCTIAVRLFYILLYEIWISYNVILDI